MGDGGNEGGGERICTSNKSGFEMGSLFLCLPVIGSLNLEVGGGYVQLEYSFFLSGSLYFLCKGVLRGRKDFL